MTDINAVCSICNTQKELYNVYTDWSDNYEILCRKCYAFKEAEKGNICGICPAFYTPECLIYADCKLTKL